MLSSGVGFLSICHFWGMFCLFLLSFFQHVEPLGGHEQSFDG